LASPYEPPQTPDLVIDTAASDVERSVAGLTAYIHRALTLSAARRETPALAAAE